MTANRLTFGCDGGIMSNPRFACTTTFAACVLSLAFAVDAAPPAYSPPRTSDGKPDLQGIWTNASLTTLERARQYSSLTLSDAEVTKAADAHPQTIRQRTDDGLDPSHGKLDGSDLKGGRGYNAFWTDPGIHFGVVKGTHRTSWIVDPANGRIPYTEPARAYLASLPRNGFDGPESRPLGERCIAVGARVGPPMVNGLYNNNYQIVQTRDHVVILVEMIQHARIVRLNARHAPEGVPSLFGDSIGHWEGDTLVVETTNFHALRARSANPAHLSHHGKVIERFTRASKQQILYEFTVEDPQFYAQPWRGEMSFNASSAPLYEYACHEGNYALSGVLSGARAEERAGKTPSPTSGGE
jgi:hypothetical protein